jgi:uncharacterized protein YdhG (YjbR/CyaY superfamily)
MEAEKGKPASIDEYIAKFPIGTRAVLQKIRQTIQAVAPQAREAISYGIPTFTLNSRALIYFAGYANHIGVYPVPKGSAEFNKRLKAHRAGRGTLRFALDKPIPYALIREIVKNLRKGNAAKGRARAAKR